MKKLSDYAIGVFLIVIAPLVIVVAGFLYIDFGHVGPPTVEQLLVKYPTCEQRGEFVATHIKESQTTPTALINRPARDLDGLWQRYRAKVENILEDRDERIFAHTLYKLGSGCWHD
ncbi:hypothetical protein [Acaryochloris marina]|uniref:Uncharacterized protein n=1 Tax=Acaryochloris marina (strain MBIC 11017) TaxID=329726 RepID=A8ZNK7_ACAM1|nr:hypothetical protein [Acaryochloris marina]ABW32593.1 hypothetical protein AM1_D0098 [Acaryochloris marina MBIC11017]